MVNIYFYKCTAEKNRLFKNNYLTAIPYQTGQTAWQGVFKEDTSIINPSFIVKVSSSSTSTYDFNDCNYCRIAEFNRYYFIKDIVSITQGTYRINCHVDVLQSYNNTIRGKEIIAARHETIYNANQRDGMIGTISGHYYDRYYITGINQVPSPSIILTTVAGGPLT